MGGLDRTAAEAMLRKPGSREGDFLLRVSTSQANCLALSVRLKLNVVSHRLIVHTDKGWIFQAMPGTKEQETPAFSTGWFSSFLSTGENERKRKRERERERKRERERG